MKIPNYSKIIDDRENLDKAIYSDEKILSMIKEWRKYRKGLNDDDEIENATHVIWNLKNIIERM